MFRTPLALIGTIVAGAAWGQAKPTGPERFEAPIRDARGEAIGTLTLRDGANALVVRVSIRPGGLPPGWHAMHLHAVGDCSGAGFPRVKGIVNHDQSQHGLLNPDGPSEGDLPNLRVAADGSAEMEAWSEAPLSGEGGLRDADGAALIIHAGEDDHVSQPVGGAGERIACAVIK